MPLEYEMMEEPIDEIPDVESAGELRNLDFGWSFQTLPATSSHRSRGLWSRDPGGSCDARHRRPNPVGIADQALSRMTSTQRPP